MCVRTDNNKNNISSVNTFKTDKYLSTDAGEMEKMHKIRSGKPKMLSSVDSELDALAVITSQQKKFLQIINEKMENFHQSHYYKVMFGTTQPAHIISVITVSLVVSLLYSSSTTSSQSSGRTQSPCSATSEFSSKPSSLIMIIYLLAFCTHFGSQFWMTFISGLSLYFSLPRHAFGSVQKVLFPKYFSLNAFLSAVTLVVFNKLNYPWNNGKILQEVTLSVCFFLELVVRLYAVPPLLKLISAKTEIESSVGIGQEIGYHDPGPLKNCPHYIRLHKKFRQVHLYVAIGNIIALICTALHLQYLAYHLLSFSNCQQQ